MKRRELLIAAAAGTTGIAGFGTSGANAGSEVAARVPHADEFGTVVDAVEAGADPSGEQPVNFLFEEYAEDETLLAFEPGTYEIDYFAVSDVGHFGVVGTGAEPARFVPASGQCRGGHPWVAFQDVRDLLLENITLDFRETGAGGPLHLFLEGDSTIRNLTYLGSCSNQIGVIKIDVRDAAGTARVENAVARNVDDNQSLTGMYVTRNHAGELTFVDCQIENFSDNGLYASSPGNPDGRDGAVHVIGGTYRNNNVAGVRLGSTGARAEDVTVVVDSEVPGWGDTNARGIRLRNKAGQVIDGCDITFGADAAESFGGIVFHRENGGARVSETTVTVDRGGVPAVRAFPVAAPAQAAPVFENCRFTGGAEDGATARIEGRDGTVFRDCAVEGTGNDRRGLHFFDSENCRIVDSRLDVSAVPVAVENGSVDIENTIVVTGDGDRYIEQRTLENETLNMSPKEGVRIVDQTTDGASATVSNYAFGAQGKSLGVWTASEGTLNTLLGSVTTPSSGTNTSVQLRPAIGATQPVVAAIHGGATPTAANVLTRDSASLTVRQGSSDELARFDTNGKPGIQIEEVLETISEFNGGGTMGGQPVEVTDVLAVIDEFNR